MNTLLYMMFGALLVVAPELSTPEKPGSIFLSKNEGDSWLRADAGLPTDDAVNAWAVAEDVVILSTENHGVYTSSDGLKTWHTTNRGLPEGLKVKALVMHGGVLFAGTYRHGVYVSPDAGSTWKKYSQGLGDISVRCLYSLQGILYAGTDTGIYRSQDDGWHWTQVIQGLQVNTFTSWNGTLYAATSTGAMRSGDGVHWSWSWKQQPLFSISADQGMIASVNGYGEVYTCPAGTDQWVILNITFNEYTFRITPASTPMLAARWRKTFRSLREQGIFLSNGLPENQSFNRILVTPFGVLVAAGGDGC